MDYELIILRALVEIVMDEDASEHLKELRIAALNKVLRRLNAYHHLGFIRPLTTAIAEKKCSMIQKAATQAEIKRILGPRCPRYDGNKFVEDPYILPEEESDWMELCIPSDSAECCWCRKISGAVQPYLSQWCEWGDSGCVN